MKNLKKLLVLAGAIVLAVGLAGCQNAAAAKNAFISSIVKINNTSAKEKRSAQDVTIDIKKLKATGSGSSSVNQLNNSQIDFIVGLDKTNQIASLAGNIQTSKENFKVDTLLAKSGIYIDSNDLKTLYNQNKSLLPASAASSVQIYDDMLSGLTKPYLFLDAQSIDQTTKSSNQTWESGFAEIFKTSDKSLSETSLTKSLKNVPNSDFTKKGDEVTFSVSQNKEKSFTNIIKEVLMGNVLLPSSQLKSQFNQLFKVDTDGNMKNMTVKVVVNTKTQQITSEIAGKVTSKDKSSLDFDIKTTSKSSQLKTALQEPAADQRESIVDLENAAVNSIMNSELNQ